MARVAGDQYLVRRFPGEEVLTVSEVTILERRVDVDLVCRLLLENKKKLRKAESPTFLVVGSPIGNPIRALRNREEMLFQFRKRDAALNGDAVIDDVQI